jgi:hypothetical protein
VILEAIGQDATAAMIEGTIDSRTDTHISRTPLVLDEAGWEELSKILATTLESAMKIGEESASRLANDGSDGISSSLSLLHFEVPAKEAK